jgi:hypothetical protein
MAETLTEKVARAIYAEFAGGSSGAEIDDFAQGISEAFARAAIAVVIEEAAKVAEEHIGFGEFEQCEIAAAIRRLAE